MGGITALYRYTQISESDREKMGLINREMQYRGPDENGIWTDKTCGLAHTRLSIIGLQNGRQPLFNEDKSLVLVCSGEIYNYIDWKFLYYINHCLKNHFDIAGLIEKGHAIDINTLKVNPYKKK